MYIERNKEVVVNVSRFDVIVFGMVFNLRLKEENVNEIKVILNLMFKIDFGLVVVNRVISSFVREGINKILILFVKIYLLKI